MKKVKTIIASLIIIVASAFLSACSCSGDGATGGVNPINVSGIVLSSDHDRVEVDPETKYLTIRVRKGEEFNITYDLSPTNTTATQVNWEFEGREDVAVPKRNYYPYPKRNYYTYAQGTTHTISWVAKEVGNTIVKFSTVKGTSFTTQAQIIVGEPIANLPTFFSPTGINYNPATGKVTWSAVTKIKLPNGVEAEAPMANGVPSGLRGYEVRVVNLTTGAEFEPAFVTKCEYELTRGIPYMVSIVTKGDSNETVKDSDPSASFRFHQLASPSDVKNQAGEITFTTPVKSAKHVVYYSLDGGDKYITTTCTAGTLCSVPASGFVSNHPNLYSYDVYVVSYPEYYDEVKGYYEDPNTLIKFYPSIADTENAVHIERLRAPQITMEDKLGVQTISTKGSTISFNNSKLSNIISWDAGDYNYSDSVYGVKYEYEIRKGNVVVTGNTQVSNKPMVKTFDTSLLWERGAGKYTLVVTAIGNPATTIPSASIAFDFTVLGDEDSASNEATFTNSDYGSEFNSARANDCISGIELFFIGLTKNGLNPTINEARSLYKFIEVAPNNVALNNYNLDTIAELTAGEYEVWGKFVGINNVGGKSTTTSKITKLSANPIIVCSPVTSMEMSSDGMIKFSPVPNIQTISGTEYDVAKYFVNIKTDKDSPITVMIEGVDHKDSNGNPYNENNIYRNVSYGYTNAKYTQSTDGKTNYISLYDILANFFIGLKDLDENIITSDNVMTYVNLWTNNKSIEIAITRKGDDDGYIDSRISGELEFSKVASVESISAQNNQLTFKSVGEGINYKVTAFECITDGESERYIPHYITVRGQAKGKDIFVDLSTIESTDGVAEKKSLITYLTPDSNNKVKFEVEAIGYTAEMDERVGYLNSTATRISFDCVGTPVDLSFTEDGTLSWKLPIEISEDLDFELEFQYFDGENYVTLVSTFPTFMNKFKGTIDSSNRVPVLGTVEIEEGVTEETVVAYKYSYNIDSWIDDIYSEIGENCNLKLSVRLLNENKFSITASEYYYIVKLPTVELEYAMSGSDNAVAFDRLTFTSGIKYSMDVYKDDTLMTAEKPIIIESDDNTIVKSLKDMIRTYAPVTEPSTPDPTTPGAGEGEEEDEEEGEENEPVTLNLGEPDPVSNPSTETEYIFSGNGRYVIYVTAYKPNSADNSATNPFVVSSSKTSIVIHMISNQVVVTGNGTSIRWNGIHDDAEYTIEYKAPGESNYVAVAQTFNKDDATNNEFTFDVSELFTDEGAYDVRVIPSIDYETTGYILSKDSAKVNTINKLGKPESINTENGQIVVTMNEPSNASNYQVNIQRKNGDNFLNMSSDSYTMTTSIASGNVTFTINILDSTNVGSDEVYRVMISAENCINGEYSDELTANKLVAPNNLEKYRDGDDVEWIAWDKDPNATSYELKFNYKGSNEYTTVYINYVASPESVSVKVDNAYTNTDAEGRILVKVDGNRICYRFDESYIVKGIAGDYEYRVIAKTNKTGYLNSGVSDTLNIHKLDNRLNIAVNGQCIELSGYDTAVDPNKIIYTIRKVGVATVQVPVLDNEGNPTYDEETHEQIFEDKEIETILGIYISDEIDYVNIKEDIALGNVEEEPSEEANNVYRINLNEIWLQPTNIDGTIIASADTFQADAGMYKFTIQFLGDGSLVLDSDINVNEDKEIEKLETTIPYVSQGVISWNAVTSANTYSIRLTSMSSEEEIVIDNLTDARVTEEDMQAQGFTINIGEYYNVSLMSGAQGKLSSVWSDNFVVKKLLSPTHVQINSDDSAPMITWHNPNTDNTINFSLDIGTPNDDSDDIIINNVGPGAYLSGQLLPTDKPLGEYEIRMQSLGSTRIGGCDQVIIGEYEFNVVDSKINIGNNEYTVNGGYVTISAGEYDVIDGNIAIGSNTYAIEGDKVVILGMEFDVADDKVTISEQQFAVIAGGVGLLTSNWSNEGNGIDDDNIQPVIAKYIQNPGPLSVNNGNYNWEPIDNAYGYRVSFFKEDTLIYVVITDTPSYKFTNEEFNGDGYFDIQVEALITPNNGIITTDADAVDETENRAKLYRSPIVSDVSVNSGVITWSISLEDVKDYLTPYFSNVEETTLMTELEVSTTDNLNMLVNKSIDYVINKINKNASEEGEESGSLDVDYILYNLYSFRLESNGVSAEIMPSACNVMIVTFDDSTMEYTSTPVLANYINGANRYLVYKYNISSQNPKDTEKIDNYPAGKYEIRVASMGNIDTNENVKTATVNSNYSSLLTVYKPLAPVTWSSEPNAKQISNGELLWTLVTTSDSTLGDLQFHDNYEIIAMPVNGNSDTMISSSVNYNDTEIGGVNPNLTNNCNYRLQLKNSIFNVGIGTSAVSANANYNLYIKVKGTENSRNNLYVIINDLKVNGSNYNNINYSVYNNNLYTYDGSSYNREPAFDGKMTIRNGVVTIRDDSGENKTFLVMSSEKIYLNSDFFSYTDKFNVLDNNSSTVINNELQWNPCPDSSSTYVYVYGPFEDDYMNAGSSVNVLNEYLRHNSLKDWKNYLRDKYSLVNDLSEIRDEEGRALRHVFRFDSNLKYDEETGEIISIERLKQMTLENNKLRDEDGNLVVFGNGTYIIRTREIGDGKGIIDSEFNEDLFVFGNDSDDEGYEPKYGLIARKLSTTSATIYQNVGDEQVGMWIEDGKFKWSAVPGANAYAIRVVKYDTEDAESGTESDPVVIRQEQGLEYELPNYAIYDGNAFYSIKITAMNVNEENRINDNFFSGDEIETLRYGRKKVPVNIEINENGIFSWNNRITDATAPGYRVYVNHAEDDSTFTSNILSGITTQFDLGNSDIQTGVIEVSVQTIGNYQFLSSQLSDAIIVHKISNPEPRVIDGVFSWGTDSSDVSGENQTKTIFTINSQDSQDLDIGYTSFKLYNDILDSTKSDRDVFKAGYVYADEYSKGVYDLSVQFKGDVTGGEQSIYRISSSVESLSAEKIDTPAIETIEFAGDIINAIKWKAIANAEAYRVLVFEEYSDDQSQLAYSHTLVDNIPGSDYYQDWFTTQTENEQEYVVFDLAGVIADEKFNSENGMGLKIYVQAIGTLDSKGARTGLYLNSGYSEVKSIKIPAMPTSFTYNSNSGLLKWTIAPTESAYTFNAILTTKYTVENVNKDEFNAVDGYWQLTTDMMGASANSLNTNPNCNSENRYSEIKKRVVVYTENMNNSDNYDLTVTDIILLEAKNYNNHTPTSYTITNTGINYQFGLVLTIGDDIEKKGNYQSDEKVLGNASTHYEFKVFANGDGSELLPYEISDAGKLNRLRDFLDRHFIITNDINLTTNWNTIAGEFTGTLDGQGHTISNIAVKGDSRSQSYEYSNDESGRFIYASFIRTNKGTIENVNMHIDYSLTGTYTSTNVHVAGLAVNNYGTISNVNIIGYQPDALSPVVDSKIYVRFSSSMASLHVAGLVNNNSGTITNCSVELANNDGIYVMHGNETVVSHVGGVVTTNEGTINACSFDGGITANYVGGIACHNYGNIIACSVTGTTRLIDTYLTYVNNESVEIHALSENFGGIAGIVYDNAKITNSYSTMNLIITKGATKQCFVGGLVGQVNNGIQNVIIENSYAVVSFAYASDTENVSYVYAYPVVNTSNNKLHLTNVYYVIDQSNSNPVSVDETIAEGITKCDDSADLNNKLKAWQMASGSEIYNTSTATNPPYPTLKNV